MMRSWVAISVCLAVLAGCATPAERAARAEREIDEMMTVYGPACERLGYGRDSDQWRDCILRLATKEGIERQQRAPLTSSCFVHRGFLYCTHF